ncbi:DNA mismatch repair protein MLH3 [Fusarium oxysporum f. sp. lycopersici 4287]|uniref:DNA mismatch repair protein MLH3 n=3 Tax=Fusarium oxysporum TaxID=5507 RepID=A0A0J9VJV1_FUSO4|nr:DNA mismatch repair protein MLH3 [Fusarium oxysporum f. sp. lycopersici 4287]EXK46654.1 DNA mismatch repair protein MLH3 [Fusarium oxysporum f. sp. melonis 26406]KNB11036.1 DNA mismatch repair protein MLH3 [Fusarium oxysporum f. sp. lycopersici 4287]
MVIRQLPQDVVDKIKSSVNITSLNGVVCGLITNSLDAGASKVNVSIDYSRGNCTVEDNGSGIPPEEFKDGGGLGKLHHTSKFPSRSSVHGKHGDFLASLATFSLLTITSHHQGHISHNSISFHNSRILARQLPSPPESRLVNFDHGTRSTVRDLFGNMPVRVKQRATLAERSALDKEWSRLVRAVVGLFLAWPLGVSVSLKNAASQRELRFRPAEKADIMSKTSRLLTQAGLANSDDAGSWVPISASCGSISVKGAISTNPVATRRSQFISLGIRPINNEFGTDVLYEEINKTFGNSSFGVIDADEDQNGDSRKLDEFTGRDLRSRKGIERWPMFYLKITATGLEGLDSPDRLDSQGRTLSAIIDLLKATCYGFLKKHHFRPQKVRLTPEESLFSTARTLGRSKKPKKQPPSSSNSSRASSVTPISRSGSLEARADSPFEGWHRIKVGRATPLSATSKAADVRTKMREESPLGRLVGEGGKLLRKPFDEPSPEPEDEKTGSSANSGVNSGACTVDGASGGGDTSSSVTCQGAQKRDKHPSKWLQGVIRSWENPIFQPVEPSVPCIDSSAQDQLHACGHGSGHVGFETGTMSLNGRISRHALARATVIEQVDRKFILVKLPLESSTSGTLAHEKQSSALVMLDQHAVDERCQLEDLMANYFTHDSLVNQTSPVIEPLDRPIIFEISKEEWSLLEQYQEYFAAWGITYQTPVSSQNKILVTGLPPSIIERCRLEPRLLIELLRTEVWRSVDSSVPLVRPSTTAPDKPLISRFNGCPRGILELLHSRACRSAIMFNDVLSVKQCEELISRLSRCAFPFQCAHGRPSMAPLIDLGNGGKFGGWQESKRQKTVSWKSWIKES